MSLLPGDEAKRPAGGRLRRLFGNLAWVIAGMVLTILLIASPIHIHPLDRWIHGLVDRWHTGASHAPATAASAGSATSPGERKVLFYRNPMNPAITSPVPAKDEMGMDYVPVYADQTPAGRKVLFYRNPLNPAITSPVPAKDEMGMDYVPVYADQAEEKSGQGATVSIDPAVVQNMNVQTEVVKRRDVTREIRTVGYLDYDQQKMVSVTTKYPGFIEKVFVNYLGEPVREGQRLFEIYAPELVQTQQDLLTALAFVDKMKGAPEDARRRAEALVEASRARLGYWDISAAQIQRLEATKEVVRTLVVTAPAGGVVMKRMPGLEGMAVKPGMELLHIADLSSLWLSVEVFEDQLAWLKVGSVADINLSYFPGERFTGKVRFIEPQVSEKTRTVPLRLEVPNPGGRLRSGMYATVRFHPAVARKSLAVPSMAVLRTGERNLVIVELEKGRFAPREVELGGEGDGFVDVLSGLKEGDRVVTSSQFLIDSESNLREAIQKMIAAGKGAGK